MIRDSKKKVKRNFFLEMKVKVFLHFSPFGYVLVYVEVFFSFETKKGEKSYKRDKMKNEVF